MAAVACLDNQRFNDGVPTDPTYSQIVNVATTPDTLAVRENLRNPLARSAFLAGAAVLNNEKIKHSVDRENDQRITPRIDARAKSLEGATSGKGRALNQCDEQNTKEAHQQVFELYKERINYLRERVDLIDSLLNSNDPILAKRDVKGKTYKQCLTEEKVAAEKLMKMYDEFTVNLTGSWFDISPGPGMPQNPTFTKFSEAMHNAEKMFNAADEATKTFTAK